MIAGNNLVNAGLIEAGNRLDLLAGNDLINTAGGIITGHDVSLTAINDDVINKGSLLESGRDMTSRPAATSPSSRPKSPAACSVADLSFTAFICS
ncbi:Filamentous hemagglutinin family protein [Pseudomonas amygdali pv. dendropanacis]|uniref:Filamentous hemagglutinin family protein n=1 Tax=Pseudomonas amygdali pv. dendropanacis TaxID=235272 RepID=A0A0P9QBT4_PSEA0|nr:hypothetical protein [Pseudomonas amygdali]KPX21886.1 Filamentous hemagglutinin family protein [Pseudomonas amygdali pv. dendropanacis]KWS79771.1 hypothetical protein AL052_25665 [Pseudomonas amygdali pv. eriobotryae]KWS81224.1 hypothetical protein AL051_26020 [Pseudomonas amygdali pv. dendropanacis]